MGSWELSTKFASLQYKHREIETDISLEEHKEMYSDQVLGVTLRIVVLSEIQLMTCTKINAHTLTSVHIC